MLASLTLGGFIRKLAHRLIWLRGEMVGRQKFLLYSLDLSGKLPDLSLPAAVEFRINDPVVLRTLEAGSAEYDGEGDCTDRIRRQLDEGEICLSAWVEGQFAFYGWLQFRQRQLARHTSLSIGRSRAFIYRCFTRADFRGRRLYPAALQFAARWLAGRGCSRVLIDHHVANQASRRGILAAGFQPVGTYCVYSLLGYKWAAFDDRFHAAVTGDQPPLPT